MHAALIAEPHDKKEGMGVADRHIRVHVGVGRAACTSALQPAREHNDGVVVTPSSKTR